MLTLEQLAALAAEHAGELHAKVCEFEIGNRRFAFNTEPAIMGVINLSPDSWYRESVCLSAEAAIQRARVLAAKARRWWTWAQNRRWRMRNASMKRASRASCCR